MKLSKWLAPFFLTLVLSVCLMPQQAAAQNCSYLEDGAITGTVYYKSLAAFHENGYIWKPLAGVDIYAIRQGVPPTGINFIGSYTGLDGKFRVNWSTWTTAHRTAFWRVGVATAFPVVIDGVERYVATAYDYTTHYVTVQPCNYPDDGVSRFDIFVELKDNTREY
jgi:hypothetical protein